jgi:hypothetical protein
MGCGKTRCRCVKQFENSTARRRAQGNRVLTKQALKGSSLGLAPLGRLFFFRVKQSSRTPAWSYSKARLAVLGCQVNLELDCPADAPRICWQTPNAPL